MKQDFDFDYDDPLEDWIYSFAWGLVWTAFITYPLTQIVFLRFWVLQSFCVKLLVLATTWLFITVYVLKPCRDFLERRAKR